ncbi:MAG: hypothetical protein EXS38_02320 [Opitutus sp.]|nr:hypothetical protein [Opitutus sp.]
MNNRKGQNDDWSKQPRGGVGEHGMTGRLRGISGENSPGGCAPNARLKSAPTGEAAAARGVVGSVHSSEEGRNETGVKGPNLNAGDSVATDEAMAPLLGLATPLKVQALQRTLYRKAKENRRRASPWENGFVESFHSRFRDECLNREQLWTLTEARVVIEDFRLEYNAERPHSSLGYLSPQRFVAGKS